MKYAILILMVGSIISCSKMVDSKSANQRKTSGLDIQGHRGARGLMPENSIPGFLKAMDLGVTTLEMDVCVTGDGQVVVSHEPYFSPDFCLRPDGSGIPDDSMHLYNVYQMDYSEIRRFDCGSKDHPKFPDQEKMAVFKPLLAEVFIAVEDYISGKNVSPVRYNIELKSEEQNEGISHPSPEAFSDLVFRQVDGVIEWDRVTIQSFDFRVLRYFREIYPDVRLAQLIANDRSWRQNVEDLGFIPEIYSCHHTLLEAETISEIQESGMRVIPWTVNDAKRMRELAAWGVDGIITDYPNIAIELFKP